MYFINEHPNQFHQTYVEHLLDTLNYSSKAFLSGGIILIHGFFPFLFKDTGIQIIQELFYELKKKKKEKEKNT